MADVLPPQSARWARLLAIFAGQAERAGFGLVITPLIEDLEVFQRVGEATDIVRKEMYDFEDKGGRRVALRPEITAGLMRAFVEHHPARPGRRGRPAPTSATRPRRRPATASTTSSTSRSSARTTPTPTSRSSPCSTASTARSG